MDSIFEEMPAAVKECLSRQYMTQGKRILDCLYALSGQEHVAIDSVYYTQQGADVVNPVVTSPGSTLSDIDMESRVNKEDEDEYVLGYEAKRFTAEDRAAILLEI